MLGRRMSEKTKPQSDLMQVAAICLDHLDYMGAGKLRLRLSKGGRELVLTARIVESKAAPDQDRPDGTSTE